MLLIEILTIYQYRSLGYGSNINGVDIECINITIKKGNYNLHNKSNMSLTGN